MYSYQQPYQPYYNPYNNPQQRLQAMEQQYPHLVQQMPQQQPPPQTAVTLKGRPVTGMEEARAAQIDYDGSIHVFTDIANKKIYTKQIGMDGAAIFNAYVYQEPAVSAETSQPANDEISQLKVRISELENKINQYEGVFLNGIQPNADNGNASKQRKSTADNSSNGGK